MEYGTTSSSVPKFEAWEASLILLPPNPPELRIHEEACPPSY